MNATFAIPGDLKTKTGGYIYDAEVIDASGGAIVPLELPHGFPFPTADELRIAQTKLSAVEGPLLIDGLAYGALPRDLIRALPRPPIALCHHPLGHEPGLDKATAARLVDQEIAALDEAAHIIVTSPATKGTLVSGFGQRPDRITVAVPGLKPAPVAMPDDGPPIILTVASLTRRKGHDVLINALARIRHLDWLAKLAGPTDRDGAVTAEVQSLIARHDLANRVHILHEQDEEGLNRLYAQASLFALPSRYEGYGMVFAEAMLRGLPVVACDTGAVAELVPPNAGKLVPVDDHIAFADALATVLGDQTLRRAMGAAARTHASQIDGWDGTWAIISTVLEAHS